MLEQEWLSINNKEERYDKLKNTMIGAVMEASGKVNRAQKKLMVILEAVWEDEEKIRLVGGTRNAKSQ